MKTLLILLGLIASTCTIAGQPSSSMDLKPNLPADSLCPDMLILLNGDSMYVKVIKTKGNSIRYNKPFGSGVRTCTKRKKFIDKVVYSDGTEQDDFKKVADEKSKKRNKLIIWILVIGLVPLGIFGILLGANWN